MGCPEAGRSGAAVVSLHRPGRGRHTHRAARLLAPPKSPELAPRSPANPPVRTVRHVPRQPPSSAVAGQAVAALAAPFAVLLRHVVGCVMGRSLRGQPLGEGRPSFHPESGRGPAQRPGGDDKGRAGSVHPSRRPAPRLPWGGPRSWVCDRNDRRSDCRQDAKHLRLTHRSPAAVPGPIGTGAGARGSPSTGGVGRNQAAPSLASTRPRRAVSRLYPSRAIAATGVTYRFVPRGARTPRRCRTADGPAARGRVVRPGAAPVCRRRRARGTGAGRTRRPARA